MPTRIDEMYARVPKRSVPADHVQLLPSLHFHRDFEKLVAAERVADVAAGYTPPHSGAPPRRMSNIESVSLCNTVMPQRVCARLNPRSRERRMMTGASMWALTGGDVPSTDQQHKLELSSTSNQQFACGLITQRAQDTGTTMRFKQGNMVRAGKAPPAASMRELLGLLVFDDGPYFATISVPNLVSTVVFANPVDKKIRLHAKSNETDDFSGIYVNLKSAKRCTPGIHIGYNKHTGVQRKSSAVVPGTRTVGELFNCVCEINTMSEQCRAQTLLAVVVPSTGTKSAAGSSSSG
jgi:hypothetical protein